MPRPESLIVAMLLTLVVAMGPLSTDLYLPSLPLLTAALRTDVTTVQLTLSIFLVGFAFGQLVYGPLSDRFGRRPVLLAGMIVFLVASIACTAATSIEWLVAGRFVQALGASAGPVLGRAVVRDVYGREGAARMLAYMGAAMALAPAIGPMIGGYLTVWSGWRANFVVLAGYGVFAVTGVWFLLSETNPHLGRGTGALGMLRNFADLAQHREYCGFLLCMAMNYAGLFAYISGSSFVFIDVLGLPPNLFGFCFAATVAGFIVGAITSGRLVRRVGVHRMVRIGAGVSALGGAAMAGFVLFGVESVWSLVAPMAMYVFGTAFVLPNSMAGALGPFPDKAGAASALIGFTQMGFAALVGVAVSATFDGTALPMTGAIALAGCATAAAYWGLVHGAPEQA